jgi:hypothetical protein
MDSEALSGEDFDAFLASSLGSPAHFDPFAFGSKTANSPSKPATPLSVHHDKENSPAAQGHRSHTATPRTPSGLAKAVSYKLAEEQRVDLPVHTARRILGPHNTNTDTTNIPAKTGASKATKDQPVAVPPNNHGHESGSFCFLSS